MNTKVALRKMKVALRRRGWTKHVLYDSATGKMCLMGALNFAIVGTADPADDRDWTESESFLHEECTTALNGCIPSPTDAAHWFSRSIVPFNDHEDTTEEEVFAVIDCAIDKAALA